VLASAFWEQSLKLSIRAAGGTDCFLRWRYDFLPVALGGKPEAAPVDNFGPKSVTSVTL